MVPVPADTSSSSDDNENELSLSFYTSMVEKYGSDTNTLPSYTFITTQTDTAPKYTCTASMKSLSATGPECSSKKSAKHGANKDLWALILATVAG